MYDYRYNEETQQDEWRIHWLGWPPETDTWEPWKHLFGTNVKTSARQVKFAVLDAQQINRREEERKNEVNNTFLSKIYSVSGRRSTWGKSSDFKKHKNASKNTPANKFLEQKKTLFYNVWDLYCLWSPPPNHHDFFSIFFARIASPPIEGS